MTVRRLLGSFRVRLILGAIVWITAGTVAGGLILIDLFRTRVQDEFTSELDHHATELAAIVRVDADGQPVLSQPLSDYRFDDPTSGHYWQVEVPGKGVLRSASLGDRRLTYSGTPSTAEDTPYRTVPGPGGQVIQVERALPSRLGGPPILVAVAIELRAFDAMMAELRQTITIALAMLALGLIAAALAQVAFGLRPLGNVRQALRAISLGQARRLPDDLPPEVAPLVRGINEVLAANEVVVRRARIQAGNLAHALKTPLAVLMDEAERMAARGESGDVILRQCERMRRQIEYQLTRARAAASSASVASATPLVPAITTLVSAIARLHRDRGLRFDQPERDDGLVVSCEAEDLDEMLGNLLDNAAKWARSVVVVRVTAPRPGWVRIAVEDDGPGMPEDAHEKVFQVGQRLDEEMPGSGLGLAIVRDIAELYGGLAQAARSELGGAMVWLELPTVNHRLGVSR